MPRGRLLVVATVVLVVLGLFVLPGASPVPGPETQMHAMYVDELAEPTDAPNAVNASDPRVPTVVRTAVQFAAMTDGSANVDLDATTYDSLAAATAHLPSETVEQRPGNVEVVVLVRTNGTVYEVTLEEVGLG